MNAEVTLRVFNTDVTYGDLGQLGDASRGSAVQLRPSTIERGSSGFRLRPADVWQIVCQVTRHSSALVCFSRVARAEMRSVNRRAC